MSEVQLCEIHQSFGGCEVLRGLDLRVESGDYVVLLGKSGCGKTSLLRLIAGLSRPKRGSILIGGRRVDAVAPRDRDVSMIFQDDTLYPHLTVRGSIAFGLRRTVSASQLAERIERAAELAGAVDLLDRYPEGLSGGELRRGAIAKSIARQAAVRLMDEPLSALDASVRQGLQDDLLRWHNAVEGTSIHVTHDGQEAMRMADKIAVLEVGRIVQFASPREIYEQPNSRSVARAVGWPPINLLRPCGFGDDSIRVDLPIDHNGGTDNGGTDNGGTDNGGTDNGGTDNGIEVGVRAESFSVSDDRDDLGDRGGLFVSGTVNRVSWIDGRCHARVAVGPTSVIAVLLPGIELEVGRPCRLFAEPPHLHLFDTATGQRIEPPAGG